VYVDESPVRTGVWYSVSIKFDESLPPFCDQLCYNNISECLSNPSVVTNEIRRRATNFIGGRDFDSMPITFSVLPSITVTQAVGL
jgi:hypothetical protein